MLSLLLFRGLLYNICRTDLRGDGNCASETTALLETHLVEGGKRVSINEERFEAPECLFKPHQLGMEAPSLSEAIFDTIQRADLDVRAALYGNIVLTGGTTALPGLKTRLQQEISDLYFKRILRGDLSARNQSKVKVAVIAPPNRHQSVFEGARYLAQIMRDKPEFWQAND
jgi:actin-related protein 2